MDQPQEEFIDVMPNEVEPPPADIEHGDEVARAAAVQAWTARSEGEEKKTA